MDARCQEYSRLPNVICLLLEGQIPIFAKLPYFVTIINRSNGAKNMCQHLNAIGINSTQKKKKTRYNVVHQNDKFSCKQLYKIKVCTDFVRWVPFLCACLCVCVQVFFSVLVCARVCTPVCVKIM